MKKIVALCAFALLLVSVVWAERADVHLGFGVEANMNTNHGGAFGRSIRVDARLFKYVVPGLALTVSDDFRQFTAIEPEVFARWYLPLQRFPVLDIKYGGFYIQGDIGLSIAKGFETEQTTPRFLGGLTAGFRAPIKNGDYFVEPFIKSGYPFLVGGGVSLGCRF